MKSVIVTAPGETQVVEVADPQAGPRDILVKMKACGICGSDAMYIQIGGIPPRQGDTPLGHEPAGEIVAVGAEVTGLAVGDHVVVNPMAAPDGIIGSGGAQGGLSDYMVIKDAVRDRNVKVIPDARAVGGRRAQRADGRRPSRREPHRARSPATRSSSSVQVRSASAPHRLPLARRVARRGRRRHPRPPREGTADRRGRRDQLRRGGRRRPAHRTARPGQRRPRPRRARRNRHLPRRRGRRGRASTRVSSLAKHGATLGIVAVHKKPVPVDFGAILTSGAQHRDVDGLPHRDLRGDRRHRRELGEVRAHHQRQAPVRRASRRRSPSRRRPARPTRSPSSSTDGSGRHGSGR